MKLNSLYITGILAGLLFIISSCQDDDYELGSLIIPTGIEITYEITGLDADNPNGDGSGLVSFTATSNNAISYNYEFGDGQDNAIAPTGEVSHTFSKDGVNTYNVTVTAVGTGGVTSSKTVPVTVFSSFKDPEAVKFLAGENVGDSKTWYWDYTKAGHAGMGPNEADYGNADYTWPNWWSIGANDPEKACMYSSEFVFTKTEEGLTFQQTTGTLWATIDNAAELGVTAASDACYGEDVIPGMFDVKTASLIPSSSKAALADIANPYRGTSILLSDGGTMGWWTGNSEYDIIEITETTLSVRIIDVSGPDGYAWYHVFTSVKPEK